MFFYWLKISIIQSEHVLDIYLKQWSLETTLVFDRDLLIFLLTVYFLVFFLFD